MYEHDIERLIHADHHDPFAVLGPHTIQRDNGKESVVVRAFYPSAKEVVLDDKKKKYPMNKIHDAGIFELEFPRRKQIFPYTLDVTFNDTAVPLTDPYRFGPILSDYDLYLFSEGKNHRIYEKMGSNILTLDGVTGVLFCVWAPNARRVSVVGDFNSWDGRRHQMRSRGSCGIWELFVPGLQKGDIYKYEIKAQNGDILQKSDPYAQYAEHRPKTGSVVYSDNFKWSDKKWIDQRDASPSQTYSSPVAIYEVHPGSWMRVPEDGNRWITYRELADKLIPYVKDMGYTHIELMPVAEHPFDGSWGYQVTGYFAVTSRFGTPEDFKYFVNKCHKNGIGVIIDWVPGHFPKDAHGLAWFDGTCLYEHSDPRQGEHTDWGTLIFNYGRNEVRCFLLSNLIFWFDQFHIDGVRVDAVASMLYLDYSRPHDQWVPNKFGGRENLEAISFLKEMNEVVFNYYPGALTIAEESTSWPGVSHPTYVGGLGFSYKWNMGWMNDILSIFSKEPVHRKYHHDLLTFAMLYAFHENFILVLSHDEVVHGKGAMLDKMPGDMWQKFANLRLLYTYMYGQPGKKLLFMGGEIGQWDEWNHEQSLDWHLLQYDPHKQLQQFVRTLNKLYHDYPAFHENDMSPDGFEWIDFHDTDNNIISFVRYTKDRSDCLVFVFNFTPVPRHNYRIGVPRGGFYREILNSDAAVFGGGNIGNAGGRYADPVAWQWRSHSLVLDVPPLGGLIFKPE